MSKPEKVPTHVAIIMDGNGRWALERGEERVFGHTMGVESVRGAIKYSVKRTLAYHTVYVITYEN